MSFTYRAGVLHAEDVPLSEIAARFGTPTYVYSTAALRQRLEQRHRILLRDCRSFEGLDGSWLRIGLQNRRRHRQLLRALEQAQADGAF